MARSFSPWMYLAYLFVTIFQAVYSVPCIRLHRLCTAFHPVHDDMLLPALHNLHGRLPRGSGSEQRCYRGSNQHAGGVQVQVDEDPRWRRSGGRQWRSSGIWNRQGANYLRGRRREFPTRFPFYTYQVWNLVLMHTHLCHAA